MMKIYHPFRDLTKFEMRLWLVSVIVVTLAFALSPVFDYLTLIASLIGVTALIFEAKGYVFGQFLVVVFSVFYGIISFYFHYYGEVITYLGMTAPIAVAAVISWMRHPYEETKEVEVNRVGKKTIAVLGILTVVVTAVFYFVLGAFHTANLELSTLSVATSFFAASLTFLRSPYYAAAYAANDVVLIFMWLLAAMEDYGYIPMIACFVMFLVNDCYGLYNWRRMRRRQNEGKQKSSC